VYPADIEAVALAYPGVSEAVAFSIPDERLGEIACIALVVKDKDNFLLRSFRHHCARELADFQQPREFLMLDAIPLSALGKVDRRAVKELFQRGQA
jgi:acyl-CoA synthetase (AMP-forming)/AMP-acid ligase II